MEQGSYRVNKSFGFAEKLARDGIWSYYFGNGNMYEQRVYDNGKLRKTLYFDVKGILIDESAE